VIRTKGEREEDTRLEGGEKRNGKRDELKSHKRIKQTDKRDQSLAEER
jgi:hypothetical protein